VKALVVSVSNRASAGVYEDRTGPVLVEGLAGLGFEVDGPRVVPDGEPVAEVLREAVAASYDVVVTSGGTGITPTDRTPEMTRGVLDRELPGIPEALRAYGLAHGVPTAALSRGLAGVAGSTVVVNLPGSPGGVRAGHLAGGPGGLAPAAPSRSRGVARGARSQPRLAGAVGGHAAP
jgi:molybdenum cofactor synthesis domain-containing protein